MLGVRRQYVESNGGKIRMKLLLVGLIVGVIIASAMPVSRERVAPWRSVSFTAELPAPYGECRVAITRAGVEPDSRIEAISITLKGQVIAVPVSLFSDLPKPQLHTAHLTSEIGGGREQDGVYINFLYGDKALNGKGDYPLAQLILWDGKISGRSIRKQTSRSSWDYGGKP
jgi:hypothetical protein